jgi:hypothetical protein
MMSSAAPRRLTETVTRGRQLADDLASVLKYLEKVAGLGVEDITIKVFR